MLSIQLKTNMLSILSPKRGVPYRVRALARLGLPHISDMWDFWYLISRWSSDERYFTLFLKPIKQDIKGVKWGQWINNQRIGLINISFDKQWEWKQEITPNHYSIIITFEDLHNSIIIKTDASQPGILDIHFETFLVVVYEQNASTNEWAVTWITELV